MNVASMLFASLISSGVVWVLLAAAILLLGALSWYHCCRRAGSRVVNNSILVIGVTGPRASGKSTVGRFFQGKGVTVIDTDPVVHKLLATNQEVKDAIRRRFGDGVFDAAGEIVRKALSDIIYVDHKAKRDLEQILHPLTVLECRRLIAEEAKAGKRAVAVLVPLLFEAGLEKEYDLIVAVIVNEPILRARMKKRDNLTDAQVDERLAAQLPQEEKARRAHRVIDNSGTEEETGRQVHELLSECAGIV